MTKKEQLKKKMQDWRFLTRALLRVSAVWLGVPFILRILSKRIGHTLFRETNIDSPESIIFLILLGGAVYSYFNLWRLEKQYERIVGVENK